MMVFCREKPYIEGKSRLTFLDLGEKGTNFANKQC